VAVGKHIWLWAAALSFAAHGFLGGVIASARRMQANQPQKPVKVRIVEVKKEEPKPEPKPEPPKPEPPKEKPKPKPPPKKQPATERKKPEKPPENPPQPIQGLSKDSFATEGKSGFTAPVGNTLMTEDKGIRVEEAPAMDTDLSADAKLIVSSIVTPQYTDAALDASFEGYVTVDVFVDETGAVTDAEMKKKVGYGMDDRILAAAKNARFTPRKDKLGKALKGWAEIKFNMQIP